MDETIDKTTQYLMQNWINKKNSLFKEFVFKDFNSAFSFMKSASLIFDEFDHHPTWCNTYNKITISFSNNLRRFVPVEPSCARAFLT